jgi:NADH-quinone oxidoreductase subunit G
MPLEVNIVKITVDGKYYEVKPEKNLLGTCLALGIDIPHFCFHPALGSVGACRLCAVKKFRDKDDKKGRIVMSCMEPVAEGLIISVDDPDVRAFRASVIESLMTNHPHDCPVCDEGGECHLQDMTVMTGHNYRRFDFPKRTYNNQELGPFINHEMNRCIQCYRCVRFYRDYSGGKDLNVFASRNHVYFGRHEDGTLENEFSGNLIEVCPTGVFTDKTLKSHFTRKWDLSNAPSVCTHCSVGCNTIVSERYGSIRRVMSRYNGAVNGYFICDRGRFGYEFVNDEKRIKTARVRSENEKIFKPADTDLLNSTLSGSFSNDKKIVGIGSPRASLESNYALMSLVGQENFFHGISKKEYMLTRTVTEYFRNNGVRIPSLKQIEKADAILILGEDLTNTAPMAALAVRQAARNLGNELAKNKGIPLWNDSPVRELVQDEVSPLFIATSFVDSLDGLAANVYRASPLELADLGFEVAKKLENNIAYTSTDNDQIQDLAGKIAGVLRSAKNPLIISGISSGEMEIIHASLNIATALLSVNSNAMISMVLPECNSMGLSLLPGKSFEDEGLVNKNREVDTLIVLENDLYRRSDADLVNRLFTKSRQIIVLDHLDNKTTKAADVLLPAATFAESEGTFVNNEGRAQRYYKAVDTKNPIQESWRWLKNISKESERTVLWDQMDDIIESLAKQIPIFSKLRNYMPDADYRMLNAKMPRQTMRYSGRTAMHANIAVSEPKLSQDNNSPLAFSMEGQPEKPPASLVPFYWTPGWNSVQAMYNYLDEPDGSLKGGDPGIKLFEPSGKSDMAFFKQLKKVREVIKDYWLIVPVFQIFGSEELSSLSPSVKQRIKEPFVLMNQEDAGSIPANDGDCIQFETSGISLKVKVKIENSVVHGMAGLSVNLPGMTFIDMPCNGKFHKL